MQDCEISNHDRRQEDAHVPPPDDLAPLADQNRGIFHSIRNTALAAAGSAAQRGDARSGSAAIQRAQALIAMAPALDRERAAKAEEPEAFTQHPVWLDLKGRILRTLEAYPDAYRALVEALDA